MKIRTTFQVNTPDIMGKVTREYPELVPSKELEFIRELVEDDVVTVEFDTYTRQGYVLNLTTYERNILEDIKELLEHFDTPDVIHDIAKIVGARMGPGRESRVN